MANRLGLFTAKDLFTTSMTNQWASIEYATTIIINFRKEYFEPIQNTKIDLTRRMTEKNGTSVGECCQKNK